jgi:hypothetical protein
MQYEYDIMHETHQSRRSDPDDDKFVENHDNVGIIYIILFFLKCHRRL